MNDRYLFRAKRTDNGEWVEGYYTYYPNGLYAEGIIVHVIRDTSDYPGRLELYSVDPSTICQCTGLKDKNGKLIWENDILLGHLDDNYPDDATYVEVIWRRNGFYTREKGSNDVDEIDAFTEQNFEVCGNVFDNPELLEQEG